MNTLTDLKITQVCGMQIFDSRGVPTVEAIVRLSCGAQAIASVPSGASTGQYEAYELRDGTAEYSGRGVQKAVDNINRIIRPALLGMRADMQNEIDRKMIELDGSDNKSNLGANAILAVSLACAKAAAKAYGMPLYKYIGGSRANRLPLPMMNILNGGAHASNNLDIQEFMIAPVGMTSFKDAMRAGVEIYAALRSILKGDSLSVSVGDEGGFAPDLKSEQDAIEYIIKAIEKAGYKPGEDVAIALDVASSEWAEGDKYVMSKSGRTFDSDSLSSYYKTLVNEYPIYSIEDPFSENDWTAFTKFTESVPKLQIVGDDLFVTNPKRLAIGIENKAANAILIKPNQIGSLSETIEAVTLAQKNGYRAILSHRSGETEDTSIADIAVALNAGQIKTGAPARSERVSKYNRLLRIENSLGKYAIYGM